MTIPARLPRSVPTRAGGVDVGTYVNEIQSAHWKLITDLATQLGCSVPIYGLAPSHHAADALTPVGTNRCASTGNAPTGIGKLGLPGDQSSAVTPRPGG